MRDMHWSSLTKIVVIYQVARVIPVHCLNMHDSDSYLCSYTLNRKSPIGFVRTKPRGSVVITKPLDASWDDGVAPSGYKTWQVMI